MTLLSWTDGELKPRDVSWNHTDIMTPDDLFLGVGFSIRNGEAHVIQRKEHVVSAPVDGWKRGGSPRLYIVTMADGTEWEVVKLKCKCSDPEKSGRLWA